MSKTNQYVVFQTLRKGRNNNGVCFQITPTKDGNLMFTLAPQKGLTDNGNNPTFDYQNAFKFTFSDIEACKVALMLERQLFGNPFDAEIKFPHLNARVPKHINLKFSNGQYGFQLDFNVYATEMKKGLNIFLNEDEMYALLVNLKEQISLYSRKTVVEDADTRDFKAFVFDSMNANDDRVMPNGNGFIEDPNGIDVF